MKKGNQILRKKEELQNVQLYVKRIKSYSQHLHIEYKFSRLGFVSHEENWNVEIRPKYKVGIVSKKLIQIKTSFELRFIS